VAKTKSRPKPARRSTPKSKPKAKAKPKSTRAKAVRRAKEADWRVACNSLAEIRQQIDVLDNLIVPLLCRRHHFVTQAATFKPSVAGVVVPSRVEEIISRVRAAAAALGTNPDTIEAVYRGIIDAFTADEQSRWQELHK
jgi:isochorismate pyruvate lyase